MENHKGLGAQNQLCQFPEKILPSRESTRGVVQRGLEQRSEKRGSHSQSYRYQPGIFIPASTLHHPQKERPDVLSEPFLPCVTISLTS